jgi:hypothetical protein
MLRAAHLRLLAGGWGGAAATACIVRCGSLLNIDDDPGLLGR